MCDVFLKHENLMFGQLNYYVSALKRYSIIESTTYAMLVVCSSGAGDFQQGRSFPSHKRTNVSCSFYTERISFQLIYLPASGSRHKIPPGIHKESVIDHRDHRPSFRSESELRDLIILRKHRNAG